MYSIYKYYANKDSFFLPYSIHVTPDLGRGVFQPPPPHVEGTVTLLIIPMKIGAGVAAGRSRCSPLLLVA